METIIAIIVGVIMILTAVFVAAWRLSKAIEDRPKFEYVDENFVRKDVHSIGYQALVEKIDKLILVVDKLTADVGTLMNSK